MRAARVLFVPPVLAVCLAGCSNISRLDVPQDLSAADGVYRPSIRSIAQRVRCELAPLANKDRDYNLTEGNWVAVVQLTLDVIDDGSLAPSFAYTAGNFGFNAAGKLDASREQNVVVDFIYPIQQIVDELKIEADKIARGQRVNSRFACPDVDTNLAGDLSITTTADMALKAEDLNRSVAAGANSGVFGGYVQFVVTKNLNAVGPTWTLKHFKGPGNLAGVSEMNTDKLTFAFAQSKPADGKGATANAVQAAKNYINAININQLTVTFSGIRANTQ